jgi:hypothetical protein
MRIPKTTVHRALDRSQFKASGSFIGKIFDRSDFHDFYTIKPVWVGDFGAKV